MDRQSLGKNGEDAAERYLKKNHYKILTRNYRTRAGEIDLIASKGNVLCFVEVKTRTGQAYGLPCEAVDARKRAHIIRTAQWYLMQHPWDGLFRFDVMEVCRQPDGKLQCHLIENAFSAD